MHVILVCAETHSPVEIETLATCKEPILLRRERVSGIAGADSLHARASIDARQPFSFWRNRVGGETPKSALLQQERHTQLQPVRGSIPEERLVGGHRRGNVNGIEQPLVSIGSRTGSVASGYSQRSVNLPLPLLHWTRQHLRF